MINSTLSTGCSNWQEIELHNCVDGFEFSRSQDCIEWMRWFGIFVVDTVGMTPKIKANAYYHGAHTLIALDIYSSLPQFRENMIAVTIALSEDCIDLPMPAGIQLDMELPGIVDVFKFMGTVVSMTQGAVECSHLSLIR